MAISDSFMSCVPFPSQAPQLSREPILDALAAIVDDMFFRWAEGRTKRTLVIAYRYASIALP